MTLRIAMWSGPRNISTAMMRSWENRPDTEVVDEPFYAYYLANTQSPHPYFEEILASQRHGYAAVASELTESPCVNPIQYQKQMTHHMLESVDLSWTRSIKHCFLIRDPAEVVNSYTNSRGVCSALDIGIIRQYELYQEISSITGQAIPVIDSNDVLRNPDKILRLLCASLELEFSEAMLHWPKGKRASDGVWASHWYHNVEKSTGFAPYSEKQFTLNSGQTKVVAEVQPFYQKLYEKRLR